MKCPSCGAEMAEEYLYCEQCGEDIHIVPDFEPELEFTLSQNISSIIEEVNNSQEKQGLVVEKKEPEQRAEREPERRPEREPERRLEKELEPSSELMIKKGRKKRFFIIFGISGVCLFLAAAIIGATLTYRNNSYDYQLEMGRTRLGEGQYDQAIQYYKRAMELDHSDMELWFSLAEANLLKGNKIEYEFWIREVIQEPNINKDQLERAYGKLIAIYRDKGDYKTINEIVKNSKSEQIREIYQNFIANVPEFSHTSGSYAEIIPLKLTIAAQGAIYYTLDGTEPDESSEIYTAPIFLDEGQHIVKAVFINEYGIASESVTSEYYIELIQIIRPDINTVSGEYFFPMKIAVLNEDLGEVYYTTDGSDPNQNSLRYTSEIPMPLGRSHFKFAMMMPGGSLGEIVERRYHLRLQTELNPQDAENIILQFMLDTGKIILEDGTYSFETEEKYQYHYLYVATINDGSHYYIIAESLTDEEGIPSRTGSLYAVDIYSREPFKLQIDERGNQSLINLLIEEE